MSCSTVAFEPRRRASGQPRRCRTTSAPIPFRDVAQAPAPGRGPTEWQLSGGVQLTGARGDPRAAQGALRAASWQRDLEVGVAVRRARTRPRPTEVRRQIGEHRCRFEVEPICRAPGGAASAHYRRAKVKRSARALGDARPTSAAAGANRQPADAHHVQHITRRSARRAGPPRCSSSPTMTSQRDRQACDAAMARRPRAPETRCGGLASRRVWGQSLGVGA
jgi:hypothetical protein